MRQHQIVFSSLFAAVLVTAGCGAMRSVTAPTSSDVAARALSIRLEGAYPQHVQGFDVNSQFIYWSVTDRIVKTNLEGRVVFTADVKPHHGDLCVYDGRLFVAVNFGEFNDAAGKADSWLYVYALDDLSLIQAKQLPDVKYGAGGVGCGDGKILIVGGLPAGQPQNIVYEYTPALSFVAEHRLETGFSDSGIQTATFADTAWWFGAYGTTLFRVDRELRTVSRYSFDASFGLTSVGAGQFYVMSQRIGMGAGGLHEDNLARLAVVDATTGLRLIE